MMNVEGLIEKYFMHNGKPMIHKNTIYRMARKGEIPCLKFGAKYFFSIEAIEKWIQCDEFFTGAVGKKHRPIIPE